MARWWSLCGAEARVERRVSRAVLSPTCALCTAVALVFVNSTGLGASAGLDMGPGVAAGSVLRATESGSAAVPRIGRHTDREVGFITHRCCAIWLERFRASAGLRGISVWKRPLHFGCSLRDEQHPAKERAGGRPRRSNQVHRHPTVNFAGVSAAGCGLDAGSAPPAGLAVGALRLRGGNERGGLMMTGEGDDSAKTDDGLMELARYGEHAGVVAALAAGADPAGADERGNTALHLAAANGHLTIVDALLGAGAKVRPSGQIFLRCFGGPAPRPALEQPRGRAADGGKRGGQHGVALGGGEQVPPSRLPPFSLPPPKPQNQTLPPLPRLQPYALAPPQGRCGGGAAAARTGRRRAGAQRRGAHAARHRLHPRT